MARYSVDYDGDLSTTDDRQSYGSFDAAVGAIDDRGFDSYSVQDNRRGGGGPGRYGDTFQGGPFSGALNAVGVRPAGYRARQEAAGPDMGMAEAMAAPAMTGTTPATTAVMPPAPTIPPVTTTPSNAFPGMYVSNYISMRSPSMNPAFAGSGMTPAPAMTGDTANYVPMRDPTSPTTGVMPADLAPAYDPRMTPEMQRAMRSMPATGQAPTTTGQARPTPADRMTAMSQRALNPMVRGILGGAMGGPAAGLVNSGMLNRLPAEPFSQQSVTPPPAPSTMASPFGTRALTPYEQMQARARAAGGGITYTQPGSLRPMGR